MNARQLAGAWKRLGRAGIVAALCLGLSACFLRFVSGIVTVDDLGTFINLRIDGVSVRLCTEHLE